MDPVEEISSLKRIIELLEADVKSYKSAYQKLFTSETELQTKTNRQRVEIERLRREVL